MTGPEHYRQAELIMAEISRRSASMDGRSMPIHEVEDLRSLVANSLAAAQVHATLALAAAAALSDPGEMVTSAANEWHKVAGGS